MQIFFYLGMSLALVFWGGSGLLICSLSAACMICAGFFLIRNHARLPVSLWIAIAAIFVWSVICLSRADNGSFGWKVFIQQMMCLASFLVGAGIRSGKEQRREFLAIVCTMAAAVIVYGYYRFLSGSQEVLGLSQPAEYAGRMSGTFVSPNHFADLAGMLSIVLLGFAWVCQKALLRTLLGVASALSLAAVLLSGSRIGSVACVLAILFLLMRLKGPLTNRANIFVGLIVLIFLALSYCFQMGSVNRLARVARDPAANARIVVWSDTVRLCQQRPLAGYGLGNFQWYYPQFQSAPIRRKVDFAHSDMLQTWAEQGIVGLLVWGFFLVACWRTRPKKPDSLDTALGAAIGMVLAVAVVDFPFQIPALGMFFFALLGSWVATGLPVSISESKRPVWLSIPLAAILMLFFVAVLRVIVAQVLVLEGDRARKTLAWGQALTKFQDSARWNPYNSTVWKWMGELSTNRYLFSRGANEDAAVQAEGFFRHALAINARDAGTWLALGLLQTHKKDTSHAKSCLDMALHLDPRNGFIHDMMAKYLMGQARFEEARAHLSMALWLYPRDGVAKALLKKLDRRGLHG